MDNNPIQMTRLTDREAFEDWYVSVGAPVYDPKEMMFAAWQYGAELTADRLDDLRVREVSDAQTKAQNISCLSG